MKRIGMKWSITVGGKLFYREGEPFLFYWQEVASMVWSREVREGDHDEPVAICYHNEPVKTYFPA